MKTLRVWTSLVFMIGCSATVDTSPGEGGGNTQGAGPNGVGAGALGEDGLATTCDEACSSIPYLDTSCREWCEGSCQDVDIMEPCGRESAEVLTCITQELWHAGCPEDYDGCVEAATAYNDCLVALEQAGGGGTGP